MLSSIEMQRKQIQQESVGHVCIFRIAHFAPNQLHHRLRLHQGFPARYTTLSLDHHSSRKAVLNVNVEVCRAAQPTLGLKIGDQIYARFLLLIMVVRPMHITLHSCAGCRSSQFISKGMCECVRGRMRGRDPFHLPIRADVFQRTCI